MWCTRWFLPLILLPLPTAPPYFLILFLLSLTLHARPCFYCVVLLTTLSLSSCYWQPFPIDSPLTTPWSQNITTFAEALNYTLPANYSEPLPTVMRAADRCWCEIGSGIFFEPFNVTNWEYVSVQRLSQKLIRQMESEDNKAARFADGDNATHSSNMTTNEPKFMSSNPSAHLNFPGWLWSLLSWISSRSSDTNVSSSQRPHIADNSTSSTSLSSPPVSYANLPYIRTEYDLRPYGLGMILDLGWSR